MRIDNFSDHSSHPCRCHHSRYADDTGCTVGTVAGVMRYGQLPHYSLRHVRTAAVRNICVAEIDVIPSTRARGACRLYNELQCRSCNVNRARSYLDHCTEPHDAIKESSKFFGKLTHRIIQLSVTIYRFYSCLHYQRENSATLDTDKPYRLMQSEHLQGSLRIQDWMNLTDIDTVGKRTVKHLTVQIGLAINQTCIPLIQSQWNIHSIVFMRSLSASIHSSQSPMPNRRKYPWKSPSFTDNGSFIINITVLVSSICIYQQYLFDPQCTV